MKFIHRLTVRHVNDKLGNNQMALSMIKFRNIMKRRKI